LARVVVILFVRAAIRTTGRVATAFIDPDSDRTQLGALVMPRMRIDARTARRRVYEQLLMQSAARELGSVVRRRGASPCSVGQASR
jgi:hypothetical protein